MATRTYEIKGKYTDGTDYTAGTFTVSDGTNGTNGTNGKDALVYPNVIQTGAPTVGAMKVLVSTDFNRTPQENDFSLAFVNMILTNHLLQCGLSQL